MLPSADRLDARSWFLVLPDCPSAERIAGTFHARQTKQVSHPSGRPWLVGWWPDDAFAMGLAGETKIALIGQHAVNDEQLSVACARIHSITDLDPFARSLPGSAHLAASVGGRVRVQGTLTGIRRVFHAQVGDAVVAADRADVLARLLGAEVDAHRLALHLLDAAALYPVAGEPVWRGVKVLDTMHYLLLERDGQQRTTKWWTAPQPVVPMREGALALGEALSVAVGVRVRGRQLVSADLGGLDSTSVCCLAAAASPVVVAYTADGRDPMAEDALWARRTVAHFDNVEHHVIPGDRLPSLYDGLRETDDCFDEPSALSVLRNRSLFIPRQAAARGSQLHLTGFGGDELLAGSPAHLHAMLRRNPRLALRHARGFATQRAWRYRDALRQLMDGTPYRQWLAHAADGLTGPPLGQDTPTLNWGAAPRLPPWATPHAAAAVRDVIRTAAGDVEPLAPQRGLHVELEAMRTTSRMVRQLGEMTA
nr:asparagine synthase-related protein [Actinomycetota bacterium]